MELNDLPLVTVAIPTFNRLELLKRGIRSVLDQNYDNLEIIVSDNCSTDGTFDYLQTLNDKRLKIVHHKTNLGMVANWDSCLGESKGTYFLLMSDDDAFAEVDALTKFVNGFSVEQEKKIGLVFSDVYLERDQKNLQKSISHKKNLIDAEDCIYDFLTNKISIFPCATMFRLQDLKDCGGYSNLRANYSVDACAWISIILKYGYAYHINQPLSLYKIHLSLSSSSVEVSTNDFYALKNIIASSEEKISFNGFKKIQLALDAVWNRIPLGYILKSRKFNSDYGVSSMVKDLYFYRKRLISLSNFKFIVRHLLARVSNRAYFADAERDFH